MTDLDILLQRLKNMDETLTEIHRIVMSLNEQWNAPSDMMDAVEGAMKDKGFSIRPPKGTTGPEDV